MLSLAYRIIKFTTYCPMKHLLPDFSLPTEPSDIKYVGNMRANSVSIVLAELALSSNGLIVAIVADFATAFRLENELEFFEVPIIHFPDWETLPYDNFSPHQDLISQRISAMYQLSSFRKGVIVIPISTVLSRLCPKKFIDSYTFLLNKGDKLDPREIRIKLEQCGYNNSTQVMEHGEYAVRGSLIDIYPMGSEVPYRIDLFDNEIDSLRTFDPDTQLSGDTVDSINLLPAREYPFDEMAIIKFRSNWRDAFAGDPMSCSVYQDISDGNKAAGIEYYLPLFFDKTATFFDYLPKNSLLVRIGEIETAANEFWQTVKSRYEQYRHDVTRPILSPEQLYILPQDIFALNKQYPQMQCQIKTVINSAGRYNLKIDPLPEVSIDNISDFIKHSDRRIMFCAESPGRRVVVEELLARHQIKVKHIDSWHEFFDSDCNLGIAIAPFEKGYILPEPNIALITESELIGREITPYQAKKRKLSVPEDSISNLAELTEGAPVVHYEHGIGRYVGLNRLEVGGIAAEFLTIEYKGGDKLYVPVASLHMISRYSGLDPEHAPIHSLGNDKWEKEKRKTIEQVRDVAAELLNVYAQRSARTGFKFQEPDEQYYKFAAAFPFEETTDQVKAINEVMEDMRSPRPMDRLVCGDVGFGKTEVAMRAAFLAVQSGKQVSMLVPTTLLAQQHYQSFSDRFADFPVTIEVLSRFKTKKEQTESLQKISENKCDIVIGTHKLLQDDLKFANLGLVIIDEEHRFGVRQKEKLRSLRAEVDVLTLTATPIPRTLNMSMSGIRDLSIISTPPAKRLSVKTFVREKNKPLIEEAVNRELRRGGQVYYLHNDVETILNTAQELQTLLPNARIAVGHGQMPERELERIMSDFYHRRYNLLVCTTIIETGIDVPTANTIIIDRADKLGLAQLHQLRGRVGRSHHQAYAFCLTPHPTAMTKDAKKRLDAISSLETLGAGFTLATHDLEIRGAGELLGDDQSGNIQTVGFTMFMDLLDYAVECMKNNKNIDIDAAFETAIDIELQIPALIPDDYLPDIQTRLVLYKRISNAKNINNLNELKSEIVDRFGNLPEQTSNLFIITEIKLISLSKGIKSIKISSKAGKILFNNSANINVEKLISLVQNNSKTYSFDGPTAIKFKHNFKDAHEKANFIIDTLAMI